MLQALEERRDAAARCQAEALHDAARLDHRETLPRCPVRCDGGVHPMRRFHCLEPEAVVGEPVLGVVQDDPDELVSGHVRGAVNVPVTALASRLDALKLDPTRPVVAICLTAHRSVPAVRLLRQRGFDALQLVGGMIAWRARRLPEARG